MKSFNPHERRVIARYQNLNAYVRRFARFKIACDCMFSELNDVAKASEPIKIIMDIGTGYGIPAAWFLEAYPQASVYGIDPDAKRVQAAAAALGNRASIHAGRAPDVPNVPAPADIALMLDMIHYLNDKDLLLTLSRVYQKLRPNGRLIIRTAVPPSGMGSWMWYIENLKRKLLNIRYDYRSADQMIQLLGGAGFHMECILRSGTKGESFWFIASRTESI